jgi:four helix bundle protein
MTPSELRARTRRFAIRVVAFCQKLPDDWTIRVLAGQLLRSGTAVGANYRSACRGRSAREFCAKIGLVADEADETLFWLELLAETSPLTRSREHQHLFQEADQLTAIFTASHHTAKTNLANRKRNRSPNH